MQKPLTEQQLHAIDLLIARPSTEMSLEEVAATVGVNRKTLWNWKTHNAAFKAELAKQSDRNFMELVPETFRFLSHALSSKDVPAGTKLKSAELILKSAGKLRATEGIQATASVEIDGLEVLKQLGIEVPETE